MIHHYVALCQISEHNRYEGKNSEVLVNLDYIFPFDFMLKCCSGRLYGLPWVKHEAL